MPKKYKLNEQPIFNITNEGRSIEVKIVTDNTGRTKVMFGTLYQVMVDANDLENLVDNLNVALDFHKDHALDEHRTSKQAGLPFGDDYEHAWPANDPRSW